jgi:hypothetical protein
MLWQLYIFVLRGNQFGGNYSWTSEPKRLHRTSCRQPCGWKVLGLQRGIPYEVSRDRRS